MRARWPLTILGVITVAALVYALLIRRENAQLREAKEKLDQFCRATKWAMQKDRKDFESGDPSRQAAALDRFYSGHTIHHSKTSVLMCLDDTPRYSWECFLGEDWDCRIALAKEIEAALRARYP